MLAGKPPFGGANQVGFRILESLAFVGRGDETQQLLASIQGIADFCELSRVSAK